MKDGIYHVDFRANSQSAGSGIIVVQGGKVNGGDTAFVFKGTVSGPDSGLSASIAVSKWSSSGVSIFGNINQFDLALTGSANDTSFSLAGGVVGQSALKITITGRFLSPAA